MPTDPPLADQVYSEYLILPQFWVVCALIFPGPKYATVWISVAPVLGYFVLKFATVQSIFRTKFCPGLGLFLEVKNAPLDRDIVTLLKYIK